MVYAVIELPDRPWAKHGAKYLLLARLLPVGGQFFDRVSENSDE